MKVMKKMPYLWRAGLVAGLGALGSSSALHLLDREASAVGTRPTMAEESRPANAPEPQPPDVAVAPEQVAVEENPLLDPRATQVDPELLARPLTPEEKQRMAAELYRLHTRDATDLVAAIAAATQQVGSPFPASFLLSIAHTETHGRVLAVSPAGAVGLAQATPAAFLMEGYDGPLYVTNQYLIGTRAFIMKKPLGDAMVIATRVLDGEASHQQGLALLRSAKELQRIGIEELEALEPVAPEIFMQRVRAAEEYNAQTLETLEGLLTRRAPRAQLTSFRDRVQREYRVLLRTQQANWQAYADSLQRERDRVLRAHFGADPARVIRERPYQAGEVLGRELDARFSPSRMALFLAQHLATKRQEAIALGIPNEELDAWTAALYNGGLVNITRMRAGLMTSIRETQNYMRVVPELSARLGGGAVQPAP
jgi:hypothetical protein